MPSGNADRFFFTVREPFGVVVAISPPNFPLKLLSHKVVSVLATGDPVVPKLACVAAFTALRLALHAQDAGLPDRVFNAVLGSDHEVGMSMVELVITRRVTFTASTLVGREIAAIAGLGAK